MSGVPSSARFVRPAGVAVVEGARPFDGEARIYLARLPSGPLVVLDGAAALVWRAAVAGGLTRSEPSSSGMANHVTSPERAVAESVAEQVGLEWADVFTDVQACIADLLRRGLLVPNDSVDVR